MELGLLQVGRGTQQEDDPLLLVPVTVLVGVGGGHPPARQQRHVVGIDCHADVATFTVRVALVLPLETLASLQTDTL